MVWVFFFFYNLVFILLETASGDIKACVVSLGAWNSDV